MSNHTARLLATAVALCAAPALQASIVFVNAAQNLPFASQNGATWATAFKSLKDALDVTGPGDEMWIAKGTYTPTTGTDRTISFGFNGRKLFGGFLPGATQVSQRDPVANPTVLSGDIGVPGDSSDNSFQIIGTATGANIVIDGLIFEGANGPAVLSGVGGAIDMALATSFLIQDCIFRHCSMQGNGGALFINVSNGIVRRCSFVDNHCTGAGGAIDMQSSPVAIAQCAFFGNSATQGGGAIRPLNCSGASIHDCMFNANSTAVFGGAVNISGGPVTISTCTIANSTAGNAGGAIQVANSGNASQITNCLFQSNTAPSLPQISAFASVVVQHNGFSSAPQAGVGNVIVAAQFVDANGADDIMGTADDDLHLQSISAALDHGCGTLLVADSADLDGDGNLAETLPVDFDGEPRLVDDLANNTGLGAQPFLDFGADELDRPYRVICVNQNVNRGAGDGSSWTNAFKRLQDGIAASSSGPQPKPVEIWVAEGTYTPTDGTDRTASFMPQGNVKLFGGFAGGELSRAARSGFDRPTILSGEIGGVSTQDNSFHVVDFSGDNVFAGTVLDGFFITRGNANGGNAPIVGGGIRVRGSAQPVINNCRIFGNTALNGGGVGISGSSSNASMMNCFLVANETTGDGGAVLITGGAAGTAIMNATIVRNEASANSGGIAVTGAGSSAAVGNTIFHLNVDELHLDDAAHIISLGGGSVSMFNSCLPCAGSTVPGSNLVALDPRFEDIEGPDGQFGTIDDNPRLAPGSPCVDAGAQGGGGATVPQDLSDIDDDGISFELMPFDITNGKRILDNSSVPNADADLSIDIGASESDVDGIPTANPADFNNDGQVNGADLAALLGGWGTFGPDLDLTGDCVIDGADLAALLGAWTS